MRAGRGLCEFARCAAATESTIAQCSDGRLVAVCTAIRFHINMVVVFYLVFERDQLCNIQKQCSTFRN